MKIALYSVSYAGLWYDGPALRFEEIVRRAREYGYDGVELDAKRPHGSPLDMDARARAHIRELVEREGLEIPCVAANNDFSSPIAEHREAQLLMVRETARLAADVGAKVVRIFAAWPGIALRDGRASYDLVRGSFYTFERQYPYSTRLERWNLVKDCLREVAAFGEEFGVVMALQNHAPLIRHWKDMYDLVREVDSPWLRACLDLPIMTRFDPDWVADAVRTVGPLQVHTHFGGEFYRDEDGRVQLRWHNWGQPVPDYPQFVSLLREIGYDGYLAYELCHPVLDERHEYAGLQYVDEQVRLAREYMGGALGEAGVKVNGHAKTQATA